MKQLNKRGFTVVELLVSFAIISVILVAMFSVIFTLTTNYSTASVGSELISTQAVITKQLADDLLNDNITSVVTCGDKCIDINYQASGIKRLEITKENQRTLFKYGDFSKKLVDGSKFDKPTVTNNIIEGVASNRNNGIITFNFPITHNDIKGDYGIHLTYQYDTRDYSIGDIGDFEPDPNAEKLAWRKADVNTHGTGTNPELASGMIPVYYGKKNDSKQWYNYDSQQWANVVTVSDTTRTTYGYAPIGSEVNMNDVNTMFTWIPRFKYKLFNVNGTVSPVGNPNMAGDYLIDIQFETTTNAKSTGTQNGEWLTHPAFTFGDKEINGFWVGKFETGYKDATTTTEAQSNTVDPTKIIIKPNSYSWRSIQAVNIYKNSQGMKNSGNPFGFSTTDDPHVAKNMEWGAMTYLTQSKYGKQGNTAYVGAEKQVRINNNNTYLTGCGANAQNAAGVATCNSYETANGMSASTTGNITGIYDTAGGSWEYVGGVMKAENGTNLSTSSSGFDQTELNQIGTTGKYLNVYNYGTDWQDRSRGHLGDATIEIGPFNSNKGSWYDDCTGFVYKTSSWFTRGLDWDNGVLAGPTGFHYWPGGVTPNVGSRIAITASTYSSSSGGNTGGGGQHTGGKDS